MLWSIWVGSIILTCFVAYEKKLSIVSYFFLALFTGPIALIIVLLSARSKSGNVDEMGKKIDVLNAEINQLKRQVHQLELKINGARDVQSLPLKEDPEPMAVVKGPTTAIDNKRPEATPALKPKLDLEMMLGVNWLNKIGIVVFALGVGFLISYSFKYFGPAYKIGAGFCISIGVLLLGIKLEKKEKLMKFGRVLMGGGWALVYFTTYAMYHFETSRIIHNQLLELCFLFFVALSMMMHVMKYKSETMMTAALIVAYLTTTLGQISFFTVISTTLLGGVVLFLFYQFNWVKTFVLGLLLTYGIHYFWIAPKISAVDSSMMNFIFLSAYWFIFYLGVHVAKSKVDEPSQRTLAAANFVNIMLYSIMSYELIEVLFYDHKATIYFIFGVGYLLCALWMKKAVKEKLFISDLLAALFVLAFFIAIKYVNAVAALLWFIEVPFLIFVGVYFKETILRFFGYGLAIYAGLYLFTAPITIYTKQWISLIGALSMAISFGLTRVIVKEGLAKMGDIVFDKILPTASVFYVTWFLIEKINTPWLSPVLTIEAVLLVFVSLFLCLKRFRVCAYVVLFIQAFIFILDHVYGVSTLLKWGIVFFEVGSFFLIYGIIKNALYHKRMEALFVKERELILIAASFFMVVAIFNYMAYSWISVALGLAGVSLIAIGIMNKDKIERSIGLVVLAITLMRVVFVDLASLDVIYRIISFITIGILFLGISFFYNRFMQDK